MANGPTDTFKYTFYANPTGTAGTYTVGSQTNGSAVGVYDYTDPNNANDNVTQLGDIANDHFKSVRNGATQTEIYAGKTANSSSFIATNNGNTFLYTNNNYANNQSFTTTDSTASPFAVCYCAGTLIRTARGDIAVEQLIVGDLAVTASGGHRPIRWIGHRITDCRRHTRPESVMPVRIAAHAFGESRPARDLLVSPGHALCVDVVGEVLIMAASLINGTTITQGEVDSVTYWHVELKGGHDVLLAENMPAESYIDMGNRAFFTENGVVALDAKPDADVPTHADFCRPFHMDGPLVDAVRAQLTARARMLGWQLQQQGLSDLHFVVDGVRVDPQLRGFVARFSVPAGARDVWLVSPTSVPAAVSDFPDRRQVGACLKGLDIDDGFGTVQTIAVDDPRLCVGFHEIEGDGTSVWRWTAGRARLPLSLWAGIDGDLFLRVNLAGPMLPRWVAPAAVVRSDKRLALAS